MTTSEIRKIPYTKPSITPLEVEFATDAAANGWGEHCYDYIGTPEKANCRLDAHTANVRRVSCSHTYLYSDR